MFPCGRITLPSLSRREMLGRCANGFGAIALAALVAEEVRGGDRDPFVARNPHFAARAKNVIFLYMDGGPS